MNNKCEFLGTSYSIDAVTTRPRCLPYLPRRVASFAGGGVAQHSPRSLLCLEQRMSSVSYHVVIARVIPQKNVCAAFKETNTPPFLLLLSPPPPPLPKGKPIHKAAISLDSGVLDSLEPEYVFRCLVKFRKKK